VRSHLGRWRRIPFFGPMLFDQSPLVYLAFLLAPVFCLADSPHALRLRVRAAGQRPEVADTLGLGVYALRSQALIVSGLSRGLRARGSPSPTPTGS